MLIFFGIVSFPDSSQPKKSKSSPLRLATCYSFCSSAEAAALVSTVAAVVVDPSSQMGHLSVAFAAAAVHLRSVISRSPISDSGKEDQKKKNVSDCVSPRRYKMPEENVKRVSNQKKKRRIKAMS